MNEGGKHLPPVGWFERQHYRGRIEEVCRKVRELLERESEGELEPQTAIKYLEGELRIAERQREWSFWELYYGAKYVRFLRRQIERLRKK